MIVQGRSYRELGYDHRDGKGSAEFESAGMWWPQPPCRS